MPRGGRTPSPPAGGNGRGPAPGPEPESGLVLLGEFGRAHGLKGEVRLKSYTGDPLAIAGYSPLTGADGRVFAIAHVRQAAGDQPDMLVARIEGVATREAAEALNRLTLHVARDRLATDTEEDEFLLADLIGLRAVDAAGAPLGTVTAVPNFGGGDLLEIAPPGRRQTVLVPFTKGCVPELDIAGGTIVVTAPEMFAETSPPGAEPPGEAPDDA